MISLSFQKPYRSIFGLPNTTLPDLALVTGINGSGKSHLLEAIKSGAVKVDGVSPNDTDIRLFNWTNLVPANAGAADPIQLGRERATFLNNLSAQLRQARQNFINQISKLNIPFLSLEDPEAVMKMTQAEFFEKQNAHKPLQNYWLRFEQRLKQLNQACIANVGNQFIQGILSERAKIKGVALASLDFRDIDEAIPLNWNPTDMFQQNFSQIFAAYHRAWEENRYSQFANKEYGENHPFLNDADFRTRFGEPPWHFVNRILMEAHLDYRINQPAGRAEMPFEAKLVNRTTGAEVSFQDLSSGEKIIMSFALCLYNASDNMRQVKYPKLLLFDEIDAPLHPSMTKDLIRVIDRLLVQEKGVKVILTTHSPATVAFSPSGALFRLDRQPRSLTPCSREQAIQALTSGYISVTESSRFVITEAKQDRIVYTAVARKLVERGKLANSPNLIFIQATDKKDRNGGGCEQVKNWSAKLPAAGLNQIFGLIDRDIGNISSDKVKVIGRYSLENYLLDPIILYAVLMHRGEHSKVFDAGLKDANYYELRNADVSLLQSIMDNLCSVIEQKQPSVKSISGQFSVEYICGKTLHAPAWLRDYRGHDLESAVRETFRILIGNAFTITRNECEDLLDMLSERLPEFIPTDLVKVFEELQYR
jgi:hypothetical protein